MAMKEAQRRAGESTHGQEASFGTFADTGREHALGGSDRTSHGEPVRDDAWRRRGIMTRYGSRARHGTIEELRQTSEDWRRMESQARRRHELETIDEEDEEDE